MAPSPTLEIAYTGQIFISPDTVYTGDVSMRRIWQLQGAKNKLGKAVEEVITHGLQVIIKRGVKPAIVLSYTEYQQLVATQKKLSAFFCESPLVGIDLDLSRDTSVVREDIAI
jgi:antitoxin Phd